MTLEEILQKEKEIEAELLKYDYKRVHNCRKEVQNKCLSGRQGELDLSDKLTGILYEQYLLEQQKAILIANMKAAQPEIQKLKSRQQREPAPENVEKKKNGFLAGVIGFFRIIASFFRGVFSSGKSKKNNQRDGKENEEKLQPEENKKLPQDAGDELTKRMHVAQKIEKLEADKKKEVRGRCTINGHFVSEISLDQIKNTDRIMLTNAIQLEKQSTSNGCWSISMQMQMAYRGVRLTQEEIRRYRPKFNSNVENDQIKQMSKRLDSNSMNEIYDLADLIQSVLPDTAHHHVAVGCSKQYREENKKFLRNKIRTALIKHNSPVSVLNGAHYMTIVGMEGDRLYVKDPYRDPSITATITIDDLFAAASEVGYQNTKTGELQTRGELGQIVIDWLEDMKYDEYGRCPEIEKQWPDMRRDSSGCLLPGDHDDCVAHTKGVVYHKFGISNENGNDFNMTVDEQIYLPKMPYEMEKMMRNQNVQNVQAPPPRASQSAPKQTKKVSGIKI